MQRKHSDLKGHCEEVQARGEQPSGVGWGGRRHVRDSRAPHVAGVSGVVFPILRVLRCRVLETTFHGSERAWREEITS